MRAIFGVMRSFLVTLAMRNFRSWRTRSTVRSIRDSSLVVDGDQLAADRVNLHVDLVDGAHDLGGDDLRGRALMGDAAVLHADDVVGIDRGEIDVVEDEDDGLAEL